MVSNYHLIAFSETHPFCFHGVHVTTLVDKHQKRTPLHSDSDSQPLILLVLRSVHLLGYSYSGNSESKYSEFLLYLEYSEYSG